MNDKSRQNIIIGCWSLLLAKHEDDQYHYEQV